MGVSIGCVQPIAKDSLSCSREMGAVRGGYELTMMRIMTMAKMPLIKTMKMTMVKMTMTMMGMAMMKKVLDELHADAVAATSAAAGNETKHEDGQATVQGNGFILRPQVRSHFTDRSLPKRERNRLLGKRMREMA